MRGFSWWGGALLISVAACGGESRTAHGDPAPMAGAGPAGSSSGGGGADSAGGTGHSGGAPAAAGTGAGQGGGGLGGSAAGALATGGTGEVTPAAGTGGADAAARGRMPASGNGGDGASGGKAAPPIPLEQVSATLAAAHCTVAERCERAFVITGVVMLGEDCVTLTKKRLELNGLERLAAAVSEGRITYHPELMQACADSITAPDCKDTVERDSPACEAAIEGSAALGEPCELDEECQGSLICDVRASCPGQCAERYGEGVRCGVDAECANGLRCEFYSGACHQAVDVGEACEGTGNLPCLPGLFCAKEVTDVRTMNRPGGTCAYVTHGPRDGTPACDPLQGILCSNEDLGAPPYCVLETIAEDSATWACAQLETPCGLALPEQCPAGEYCPIDNGALEMGALTATCIPLPGPGEPCAYRPLLPTILPSCAPNARCNNGKCQELGDVGASCSDDEQCATAFCDRGQCARTHSCP